MSKSKSITKIFLLTSLSFLSLTLFASNGYSKKPAEHRVDGNDSGWCYPLNNNSKGNPVENISFGFMSYNSTTYPYHYAQDITKGYKEDDNVYAMADGEIIRIRRAGGYGGGNPCNSEYNTLVTKHNYYKKDGSIGVVYIFYGHLKNM